MQRLLPFWILLTTFPAAADQKADFFEMRVRPVLAQHCFSCHTASKMGGLTMDSRESLLKGGQSGPALRAGDPDNSLLIQAVRHRHERLKMPPSGKLEEREIADLAAWIRDGAVWPETKIPPTTASHGLKIGAEQRAWWAFQRVEKPVPPTVKNKAWAQTAIDRFVLAKLEEKGMAPAAPADARTWIRRAAYDLTGLPPTPEQVEAFLTDKSSLARARVIDQLLASPRYGERWGRYWLDVARYADDRLNSTQDDPQPNVWRYRDWVIQALNEDMPYDKFLMAQIAGDLMPEPDRYRAGLGFFANSPQFQEDRVDALTRGFMALTAACAQCHDHKFDPIPTRDYYSLLGVFENTRPAQHPLAPQEVVAEFKRKKDAADGAAKAVAEFEKEEASQLAAILAAQSAKYLRAVRGGTSDPSLDSETLEHWQKYLPAEHHHPYLKGWREPGFDDEAFQQRLAAVIEQKKQIDRENLILLGGKDDPESVRVIEVKSLPRDDYMLWRELVAGEVSGDRESGILYYKGGKLDRFLAPRWREHLDFLRAEQVRKEKEVPEMYPFLMTIEDVEKPQNLRVRIRGNPDNLGEEAPRQFLTVLCQGEPEPFSAGAGRLDLAKAVADPTNPLTARVAVNRVWMYHFGRALVGTPGNFGRLGEKPSHPELLDYLAARLVEQGWSLKALHKEIMLSATYALSSAKSPASEAIDAENKLYWRANRRRLDVEPLRDTLLFVSGNLDERLGGEATALTDSNNKRRTVYGFVSRRSLDRTLGLFDFPNPMTTSDQRIQTSTPLQQLFFLNSRFVQDEAQELAARVEPAGDDRARIREAYRLLFQRPPDAQELRLGLRYLASSKEAWPRYAQALLSSNELLFVE
ncbi:MAG: PSD1 and planctomycete cytochrome C domain-containing protein [Acidobacteriota bacterium]